MEDFKVHYSDVFRPFDGFYGFLMISVKSNGLRGMETSLHDQLTQRHVF